MIKFLDIYRQDKKIHKLLLNDIANLFKQGDFILGKSVSRFEKNFSKFCGVKYAISCANGTDALTIALKSLNLAYCPYSNSHHGISIRLNSGKIYYGIQIENCAYNPTLSALHSALCIIMISNHQLNEINEVCYINIKLSTTEYYSYYKLILDAINPNISFERIETKN